jgi:hypothetical protein
MVIVIRLCMVNPSGLRHIVNRESLAAKNHSNVGLHIRNLHAPVPPLHHHRTPGTPTAPASHPAKPRSTHRQTSNIRPTTPPKGTPAPSPQATSSHHTPAPSKPRPEICKNTEMNPKVDATGNLLVRPWSTQLSRRRHP